MLLEVSEGNVINTSAIIVIKTAEVGQKTKVYIDLMDQNRVELSTTERQARKLLELLEVRHVERR